MSFITKQIQQVLETTKRAERASSPQGRETHLRLARKRLQSLRPSVKNCNQNVQSLFHKVQSEIDYLEEH